MDALTFEMRRAADGRLQVVLNGRITERFDPAPILEIAGGEVPVLNLGGVRHVSSTGLRELERFVAAHAPVTFVEISAAVASHLVLLPTFALHVRVESASLPFCCPRCGSEGTAVIPYAVGAARTHAPTCACGRRMELDGLPEQYLPSP